MKYCIKICLLLLVSCKSFSQKNEKIIIPKKGEIVFSKEGKVLDSATLSNSKKEFAKKMITELKKQANEGQNTVDNNEPNMILSFLENNIDEMLFEQMINSKKEYFHMKIIDSLVVEHKVIDERIIGDYFVKNIKNNTFYWLAKSDSITKSNRKKSEPIKNNAIDLREYKNDTKYISGYKCFKVTFKDVLKLEDTFQVETFYTVYVTDKIKFTEHPIIKSKNILDKYYPLYIEEVALSLDGFKNFYYLEKIKLYQN